MLASEAVKARIMKREDDPTLLELDTATQKLLENVGGVQGITLTVASNSGSPVIGDTLQVRYNVTDDNDATFTIDFGAVITGDTLPVERTFSDSNGMPLNVNFIEVELTALSSAATFQVALSGTARAGVG
jgi:hypothetical protein